MLSGTRFRGALLASAVILCGLSCNGTNQDHLDSLCKLEAEVSEGEQVEVTVSGIYFNGPEVALLTDRECPATMTWVDFEITDQSSWDELGNILASNDDVEMTVQGTFFGPPPLNPELQEPLREAFRPHWGHLGCCKTKIVIHELKEMKGLPRLVPPDE